MASTMNDALAALAAISNIINRETDTLRNKAVVNDPIIEAIGQDIIENNIMVEVNKRFDLFEAKLSSMIQPQPVVDLTKVFATFESIEERLKKLETVPVPVPVPVPAPVQVDPDILSKVKVISASFDAAINKIEAKINKIEASIIEDDDQKPTGTPTINKLVEEIKQAKEEEKETVEEAVEEKEEEAETVEEAVKEKEEAETVEEAVEEEEEEEEELTEFRYKGKDYYMDAECNVYEADEEGNPELVGVYNEVTRKITFNN